MCREKATGAWTYLVHPHTQVFLSSDSKQAYDEMRARLKDWSHIRVIGTEHEELTVT